MQAASWLDVLGASVFFVLVLLLIGAIILAVVERRRH